GRSIETAGSAQASALGSAIFAAVAAGPHRGGYATTSEAVAKMAEAPAETYSPNPGRHREYQELYAVYRSLFDHFGKGSGGAAMRSLKALRNRVREAVR